LLVVENIKFEQNQQSIYSPLKRTLAMRRGLTVPGGFEVDMGSMN